MKPVTLSIHKFLHLSIRIRQKYIIFLFIIVLAIQYYLAKRLHLCSGLCPDILDYFRTFSAASRPLLFCRPVPSNLPYAILSAEYLHFCLYSRHSKTSCRSFSFFHTAARGFFIVHLNSIHSAVGLIFRSHAAKIHPVQGLIEYLFFSVAQLTPKAII